MKPAGRVRRHPLLGRLWPFTAILVFGASGCGASSADLDADPLLQITTQDDFVFMTQNRRPNDSMDALFTGSVIADEEGCLRLDSVDDATVVWPAGYTLDTSSESPHVLDEDGASVGVLGGEFVLGGGEVAVLLATMGFTDRDRERSEACPGRFWVVNDETSVGS